jgi:hypothetical protein
MGRIVSDVDDFLDVTIRHRSGQKSDRVFQILILDHSQQYLGIDILGGGGRFAFGA